jgi:DNA-binding LytR/AlgR family response regulator
LPKIEKTVSNKLDFFFAEVNGQKVKLSYNDIAYVEGSGNYITVFGVGVKALIYQSLNGIQEVLDNGHFIRVHKSFIVSINYISAIKGNEVFILYDGISKTIPIGATYKEKVLSTLRI